MRNQQPTLNNGGFFLRHLDCTHYIGICSDGGQGGQGESSPRITSVQFDNILVNSGDDPNQATTGFLMTFEDGKVIEASVPVAQYLKLTLSNLPEYRSDIEASENEFLEAGDWYKLSAPNVYGETETIIKQIV